MLDPEEKQEIEAEFPKYPTKRAVAIDAMKIVQRRRGWVSDENVKEIAEFLDVPAGEIDGTATFYNLIFRKPVGRHVILICDSVSCWIVGYDRLRAHLVSKLGIEVGETTPDGRFTLLPMVCLGACDKAPVMMIDDDLHVDLTPEKIDRILEDYH